MPPHGVARLQGAWRNVDGELCIVADGICTFVASGKASALLVDGSRRITLNACVATQIAKDTVTWTNSGKVFEWSRQREANLADVNGTWRNTDGELCSVHDGNCMFIASGNRSTITLRGGCLTLNRWIASEITDARVKWMVDGKVLEWHKHLAGASVELQGTWKTRDGNVVVGANGECTFLSTRNGSRIKFENGCVLLNRWSAIAITDHRVEWTKGSDIMEWSRLLDPELDYFNGSWKDGQGQIHVIADGTCARVGSEHRSVIDRQKNVWKLDGWAAEEILRDSVSWALDGRTLEWHRQSEVHVKAFDGTWANSWGEVCTVAGGSCVFAFSGDRRQITQHAACWRLNGWTAAHVTAVLVTWVLDAEVLEWHRRADPRLEELNGEWKNPEGKCCIVVDGKCKFVDSGNETMITLQGGLWKLNDWIAAEIRPDRATWTADGKTLEWRKSSRCTVDDFDGLWRNSEGQLCKVAKGKCTFLSSGNVGNIKLQKGRFALNGWLAVGVTGDTVRWTLDDKVLDWWKELAAINS